MNDLTPLGERRELSRVPPKPAHSLTSLLKSVKNSVKAFSIASRLHEATTRQGAKQQVSRDIVISWNALPLELRQMILRHVLDTIFEHPAIASTKREDTVLSLASLMLVNHDFTCALKYPLVQAWRSIHTRFEKVFFALDTHKCPISTSVSPITWDPNDVVRVTTFDYVIQKPKRWRIRSKGHVQCQQDYVVYHRLLRNWCGEWDRLYPELCHLNKVLPVVRRAARLLIQKEKASRHKSWMGTPANDHIVTEEFDTRGLQSIIERLELL